MAKPILVLDFDGVCHSYKSGWKGIDVIPDNAVPGLFEFLDMVAPHYDVQIFSSRSKEQKGIDAMTVWFYEQRKKWREKGGKGNNILELSFPTEKPAAFITIDDRAFAFRGIWPTLTFLQEFRPWNQ